MTRLLMIVFLLASIAGATAALALGAGGDAASAEALSRGAVQVIIVDYPRGHVPEGVPADGPASPDGGTAFACTSGAFSDQCDEFIYEGEHWESLPVEYWVNPSGHSSGPACVGAITASAQTWEGDPGSAFDFTYRGTTDIGNSSLRNRRDGVNVVTWDSLRRYPGAIAVTSYWYYQGTGEVVEADMALNRQMPWSATGAAGAYDCQNIATHEFGHFLVLGDLYDLDASELTMYGYGALGETKKRSLGLGDELGIAAIYPAGGTPPPTATPAPPTPTPTPDDGGPGHCPPGWQKRGLC